MKEEDDKRKEEPGGAMLERLLASRTVIISGPVDAEMATRIIQQVVLLDHDDPGARITVLINSPGGETASGFAIYDMLRFVSAPVVSVVVGLAASMGSIIPLAVPAGSRFALPNAKFMIHQPLLMGYQGRATDLEIQAKEVLRERQRIIQLYSEITGHDVEQIARDIDRDKWMTAEEALDYGLIDRIVSKRTEIAA